MVSPSLSSSCAHLSPLLSEIVYENFVCLVLFFFLWYWKLLRVAQDTTTMGYHLLAARTIVFHVFLHAADSGGGMTSIVISTAESGRAAAVLAVHISEALLAVLSFSSAGGMFESGGVVGITGTHCRFLGLISSAVEDCLFVVP